MGTLIRMTNEIITGPKLGCKLTCRLKWIWDEYVKIKWNGNGMEIGVRVGTYMEMSMTPKSLYGKVNTNW